MLSKDLAPRKAFELCNVHSCDAVPLYCIETQFQLGQPFFARSTIFIHEHESREGDGFVGGGQITSEHPADPATRALHGRHRLFGTNAGVGLHQDGDVAVIVLRDLLRSPSPTILICKWNND